ncbi:MAG: TAXI family TRAP transporter solute-binding subunit [Pseudomonadota bacterium]
MRDILKVYGPIALFALLGVVLAMRLVAPPPPKAITFAAGTAGGEYYRLAEAYAEDLQRHGLAVTVRETAGTVENYALLMSGEADVAFLQGGLAGEAEREALISLGGMLAEPFWVFVPVESPVRDIGDLRTLRVAAGPPGSGTAALTERLKADWGGDWRASVPLAAEAASAELLAGQVDAAVFAASIRAPYVQALLRNPDVRLVSTRRAPALAMRYPALAPKTLFEGVIDLDRNIPAADVPLVAAIAQLGVRRDLHPAIQSVLLEAAEPIHGGGTVLIPAGTFPDADRVDLPLSPEARRYYRRGPTALRRYFSFGWANFLERAWIFLIPLITLMIPLVRVAPPIYRWRIRRKIYVWYKDLHELEHRGMEAATEAEREAVLSDIDAMQLEVGQVDVPISYNDELYHLRSHINFVEALIMRRKEA